MNILITTSTNQPVSEDSIELALHMAREFGEGPDSIDMIGLIKDDPMEKLLFRTPILEGVASTTAVFDKTLERTVSEHSWDALINFTPNENDDKKTLNLAENNNVMYFEISENFSSGEEFI